MYSKKLYITATLASLCLIFALKYGAKSSLHYLSFGRWGSYLMPSLVLLFSGVLMGGFIMHHARIKREADQVKRDRMAQKLSEQLISDIYSGNNTPPFVLYLRPFALERAIRKLRGAIWTFNWLFLDGGKINFSYRLQEYFGHSEILLISLGAPDDKQGAGHVITPESSWHEHFRQLAERATSIIVVPGIQPGTLSEIRWLFFSGLIVNTIFCKPKGYPKNDWQKMKELYMKEEDIEIPDYSSKEISFRLSSSGRYYNVSTWRTVYLTGKQGKDKFRAFLMNKL